MNYDEIVKALAFFLSNECNVSHGRIRTLLSELTGGKVELSDGMLNHLCEESALKSGSEKKEITSRLMSSPVMNADFTNINVQSTRVLVLASPVNGAALYIVREEKGHEGIKWTPLEDYVGTVVHDHDRTFYRYRTRYQECTQHDCRYLIWGKENELLFLHDKRIPANNSFCEKPARVYKRKQKQAMVLRSQKSLGYICDGLSTVHLLRTDARNVYQEITAIFEHKSPQKPKKEVEANVLT